jgi:hypothetical protein
MSNFAAAQLGLMSSAAGHALAGPQPAAQHVARFEQQLQAPVAAVEQKFYQSPSVQGSSSWGVMTDGLGQVAEQFRADSAALRAGLEGSVSSAQAAGPAQRLEVWRHEMSELSRMSYSMMNISLVTSSERLAGENVRSLFQVV